MALAGVLGFVILRPMIHVPGDAAATARNIAERGALAHIWLAAELMIVLTQALTALSFYKLLRSFNGVAAAAVFAFGLVNALAILMSAALIATGLKVAGAVSLAPSGDQLATTQLLFEASSRIWDVAALFFGLWLIPMGSVVISTRIMPKALGMTLMIGGVGYVVARLRVERISARAAVVDRRPHDSGQHRRVLDGRILALLGGKTQVQVWSSRVAESSSRTRYRWST